MNIVKREMTPVHPGAILGEDILKEMNISVAQAAKGLEIGRKQISKIVNETHSIFVEMALRLQQAFGINAEFWLDLQKKYDILICLNNSDYITLGNISPWRTQSY